MRSHMSLRRFHRTTSSKPCRSSPVTTPDDLSRSRTALDGVPRLAKADGESEIQRDPMGTHLHLVFNSTKCYMK